MRYAIAIEKAEGNHSAHVPGLPGCVATGATITEVEAEIRDAIVFQLEGQREDGMPISDGANVTDGVQRARCISFFTVRDGKIIRQVEFWPEPYAAPATRAHLVEPLQA